jgi:hypothetical protein
MSDPEGDGGDRPPSEPQKEKLRGQKERRREKERRESRRGKKMKIARKGEKKRDANLFIFPSC